MKLFLLMLFTASTLFGTAELKHITIKNQDFSIVTEAYDIYDSKGEVMKLWMEAMKLMVLRSHSIVFGTEKVKHMTVLMAREYSATKCFPTIQ
jgi:hypothetical protein